MQEEGSDDTTAELLSNGERLLALSSELLAFMDEVLARAAAITSDTPRVLTR